VHTREIMKKYIIALLIVIGILAFPLASSAANDVTVSLPGYKCVINNSTIYYSLSQYPLLSYKDITYFPMTYNYCRAMDLTTEWVDKEGLYICSKPTQDKPGFQVYPLQKGYWNTFKMTASVVTYPVYIDGDLAPVDKTYPLLNFRGVTYFPMTWAYTHDMFGWTIDFKKWLLTVNTQPAYMSSIETPSVDKNGIYYQKTTNGYFDGKLYYLDYKTGETKTSTITEDKKKELSAPKEVTKDISQNLSLKDKSIYYGKNLLCEFDSLASGKAKANDYELSGSEITSNGVTYLTIYAYYQLNVPVPYTPFDVYTFIKQGTKYKLVTKNSRVMNVGKAGKYTYFEVSEYSGYRGSVYNFSTLLKVDSSGKVENLNENKSFADYHSISLIGVANSKAYLKCIWAPEAKNMKSYTPVSAQDSEAYLSISPVNDGFFTYDGSKLKQLHKYVFSSYEFVNSTGNIYIANNYTGVVRKVC